MLIFLSGPCCLIPEPLSSNKRLLWCPLHIGLSLLAFPNSEPALCDMLSPPLLCAAVFWGPVRMKEVLPQHDISFLIQYKNGAFRVDHLHIVPIPAPTLLPSCMNAWPSPRFPLGFSRMFIFLWHLKDLTCLGEVLSEALDPYHLSRGLSGRASSSRSMTTC